MAQPKPQDLPQSPESSTMALHTRNIHRTTTGRPNNHTNKNVLERFNTRDIKGSESASVPITMNGAGLPSQRQRVKGTIAC